MVNVYQQPGENNEDLARRVKRQFELANLAKTGDPTRTGQLLDRTLPTAR